MAGFDGSRPVRRRPSTVLRQSRDQPWYAGTVDRNVTDHPRCPCSPTVRQQDRQTARAATRRAIGSPRPPAAKGPSLWPSTLERFLWCCALAVQAHRASVTPAGSLALLCGSVAGCDLARTPRDAHRPRRPAGALYRPGPGSGPRGMKALRGRGALRCRCCPGRPRPGLRPDAPAMRRLRAAGRQPLRRGSRVGRRSSASSSRRITTSLPIRSSGPAGSLPVRIGDRPDQQRVGLTMLLRGHPPRVLDGAEGAGVSSRPAHGCVETLTQTPRLTGSPRGRGVWLFARNAGSVVGVPC